MKILNIKFEKTYKKSSGFLEIGNCWFREAVAKWKKLEIPRQGEAGFTIIELIIYMGILSILLTVLTDVFTSSLGVQLESESYTTIEQDTRFITSRLAYDIHRASVVTLPASIGTPGNTLQVTINGITHTYTLNSGNLTITNNNGTDNLNSLYTTVSNLSFNRVGNVSGDNTVRVSFRLTSIIQQNKGPDVKDIQTTVGLRAN